MPSSNLLAVPSCFELSSNQVDSELLVSDDDTASVCSNCFQDPAATADDSVTANLGCGRVRIWSKAGIVDLEQLSLALEERLGEGNFELTLRSYGDVAVNCKNTAAAASLLDSRLEVAGEYLLVDPFPHRHKQHDYSSDSGIDMTQFRDLLEGIELPPMLILSGTPLEGGDGTSSCLEEAVRLKILDILGEDATFDIVPRGGTSDYLLNLASNEDAESIMNAGPLKVDNMEFRPTRMNADMFGFNPLVQSFFGDEFEEDEDDDDSDSDVGIASDEDTQ